MSKRNNNKRVDIVYSTNPNFGLEDNDDELESVKPEDQLLTVHLEKKGRGGKTAVLIKGFRGNEEELKHLGKLLKTRCGVGGSAKNGEIIIQGDVRPKVLEILDELNYKTKRVGG